MIGLFSFGGGYAIISIIQAEMESYGWMSSTEFADIIAISQMTLVQFPLIQQLMWA